MFKFDPLSLLSTFQIHSQKLRREGEGSGEKSAYDYELNFEPLLLFHKGF